MIDKVLPGQRVTADTTNKVIDICNGLQTPSESFVNTPNGTLTPVPGYQARYTYSPVPETVLQAKHGPALKMTSRGATRADDQYSQDQKEMTWFCFLGPDTATLTDCLPATKTPDSIWLGNSNTALFAEVTDSMLSSLRPAGYYADLAAYDEDSVAVKEVKLTKSDDQLDPGKNVLVICGASLDDFGKIQEDSRYSEYDEAEVVNTVLFAKINDQETTFQLPLKTGHSQQIDLVGDSQLSALELSSCVVRELSGKPFIELHEFHADNTKTVSEVSADGVDVLIRNPNGPGGGRELQYVSLSSLLLSGTYVPPDADVEDAQTSSLQTRDKDGTIVEEMFNFHLSDTVDVHISDLTSVDIVIRNPNDGQPFIEYGRLCIDIAPDAQGQSGQKSIDWLNNTHELQLYKMDAAGEPTEQVDLKNAKNAYQDLLPDDEEFVIRSAQGGEIKYKNVGVLLSAYNGGSGNVSIDSQNTALSSIGKDSSNNLELYRFSTGDYTPLTAAQYDDIVIRHYRPDTGGAEVSYVQLSNFNVPPTDTEYYGTQRSIEKPNGEYYQLYRFNDAASVEDRSLRVTLRYDGSTRYFRGDGGSSDNKDASNKVIVKHYDGNGNIVEYDGLEIVAPKVPATDVDGLGDEIGTIIGGDSNISTILSGQLSNVFWVQGDHGGGTCYGQSIGDGAKNVVVDLNGKALKDSNGVVVDWGIYGLYDAQNLKVDWGNAGLYKNSTHQTLNWTSGILYDPNNGNVSLNWDVGYAKDPAGSGCTINWNTGQLWSDDNTRVMNWKNRQLIGNWSTNGNLTIGGNGSTLTIGNTTITEAQLQQLLALIT